MPLTETALRIQTKPMRIVSGVIFIKPNISKYNLKTKLKENNKKTKKI